MFHVMKWHISECSFDIQLIKEEIVECFSVVSDIGVVDGSATYWPCGHVFVVTYLLRDISMLAWILQMCQLSFCPYKYRSHKPTDTHSDSLMNVFSSPSFHLHPFSSSSRLSLPLLHSLHKREDV